MAATPETTETSPRETASPLDGHPSPVAGTARRSGRAMAAMIVGIISILTCLVPIVAIILGIVAIVLGANARAEVNRSGQGGGSQAKAAVVLGSIGIVLALGIWIAAAISLS